MTEAALVEGQVKLRDGKKWKSRWLVLRKPSPVAGERAGPGRGRDRDRGARRPDPLRREADCGPERLRAGRLEGPARRAGA
nr:protein Dok-7-like [Manis javanica]